MASVVVMNASCVSTALRFFQVILSIDNDEGPSAREQEPQGVFKRGQKNRTSSDGRTEPVFRYRKRYLQNKPYHKNSPNKLSRMVDIYADWTNHWNKKRMAET